MRRNFYLHVIIWILGFASPALSQEPSNDLLLSPFWDFYSDNRLSATASGRGYTGIAGDNDLSGIVLNPATLKQDSKWQFYGEYIYKSKVPWLAGLVSDLDLKESHPALFAGVSYKINNYFQIGAAYANIKSFKFDLGTVITTNKFGEPTGEDDASYNISFNSISIPLVYNFKNILRLGANLNINLISNHADLSTVQGKSNFIKFIPDFGIVYKPVSELSVGVTFTPETKQNVETEITYPDTSITFTYREANVFPMHVGMGLKYNFVKIPLSIYGDFKYVNTSAISNLVDRKDFHFGLEYNVTPIVTLRTGLFTLADYRENGIAWVDEVGTYSEVFGTIGGTVNYKNFNVHLGIMDSHIFSSGKIKQTHINAGFGYKF